MIFSALRQHNLSFGLKILAILFASFLVASCGAGKSSSTNSTTPALALSLIDASGNAVTNMVIGSSYTLKATVTQSSGAASNVIVTFTSGSLATLNPPSGTALTNSSGLATIGLVPTTAGASSASASAQVTLITTSADGKTSSSSTVTVTGELNYSVLSSSNTVTTAPTIALTLIDAGGNTKTSMVVGSSYRLKATLTDTAGSVSNLIVNFSPSSSGLATTIPANGSALTDTSGVAQIAIVPSSTGATTATASAVFGSGATVTASVNYSVTSITTTLSTVGAGSTALASAGSTNVFVDVFRNLILTGSVPVEFVPSCGQITTTNPVNSNSAGRATASYSAVNTDGTLCKGAITMQANASGASAFGTLSVADPVITFGAITAGSSSLASAANTSLDMDVYINGALATVTPVSVGFTASCGQLTPNVVTTNGSGHVSANYNSIKSDGTLCSGVVTITATSSAVTATQTINVAVPSTGLVTFAGAIPSQIYLNSSGASSQATLTFKALSNGAALANWPITLTLTGNPGGVTFGTIGNTSPVLANTDGFGNVSVSIFAGGTAGAVTVKAEWTSNAGIYTTSNNFGVASGAPQQKRFSLAVEKYNIEGWEIDGSQTSLTVSVADANGNAVPAGTVVHFVSESGQVTSSCTTTVNSSGFSQCSVNFMSQAPRPADGRVAVLAYLEGIKTYVDNNANNQFDAGLDTVTDQGDAYRDDNENGQYDTGEFIVVKGGSTACAGSGGGTPSRVNTCSGSNVIATTVRGQTTILYSSNVPKVTRITSTPFSTIAEANFDFRLNGNSAPLLPMPAGTSVAVTSLRSGCNVGAVFPSIVPNIAPGTNSSVNIGSVHSLILSGTAASGVASAVICSGALLQVATTSPSGTSYITTVSVP